MNNPSPEHYHKITERTYQTQDLEQISSTAYHTVTVLDEYPEENDHPIKKQPEETLENGLRSDFPRPIPLQTYPHSTPLYFQNYPQNNPLKQIEIILRMAKSQPLGLPMPDLFVSQIEEILREERKKPLLPPSQSIDGKPLDNEYQNPTKEEEEK